MGGTALALALSAGQFAHAAPDDLRENDPLLRALAGDSRAREVMAGRMGLVTGGLGGWSWAMSTLQLQDEGAGRVAPANGLLRFDDADVALEGQWDDRHGGRAGASFGFVLDEKKQTAVGGGILFNQDVVEGFGQVQAVLEGIDARSVFTLGEQYGRKREFFTTGGADVATYTTYLNWFRKMDGKATVDAGMPPWFRDTAQTLLNGLSAINGTLAYTYAPLEKVGDEGSPRTHALDASLRAVSPAPFGAYFPISFGGGVNSQFYRHVDATSENKNVGYGGAGIAFLGSDWFHHDTAWLVGVGGEAATDGTVASTLAGEVGPLSVSWRYTSQQDNTILVRWRLTDLFSERDRQRASTLNVADGRAPLTAFAPSVPSAPDPLRQANSMFGTLGFMPPTGGEVTRPNDARGEARSVTLSARSVQEPPRQVQEAVQRTDALLKTTRADKNQAIRAASSSASTGITPDILTLANITDNNIGNININAATNGATITTQLDNTKTYNQAAMQNSTKYTVTVDDGFGGTKTLNSASEYTITLNQATKIITITINGAGAIPVGYSGGTISVKAPGNFDVFSASIN